MRKTLGSGMTERGGEASEEGCSRVCSGDEMDGKLRGHRAGCMAFYLWSQNDLLRLGVHKESKASKGQEPFWFWNVRRQLQLFDFIYP